MIVFSAIDEGIFRVPGSGGTPTRLTIVNRDAGDSAHLLPVFLPDGRHFLYLVGVEEQSGTNGNPRGLDRQQSRRTRISVASCQTSTNVAYVPPR